MSNNYKNNTNIIQKINNGNQACAACKYQRRKCASDCILAPYFPQNRQGQFINAHKLFGVSNITKIIRHLEQPLKDEAMRTIIFQSDARASDPVGGCYRIIQELQRHINYYTAELELVYHHLELCRAHATNNLIDVDKEEQDRVHVQSNIQQEPEDQCNKVQTHQHQALLQDVDNYTSNCQEISDPYEKNNYQQYYPHDNITQNNQVSLEEINSWGMQESGMSYVQFMQQNCIITEGQGDDIRPLLDLPIDRLEFKFDLEQTTDSIFGLTESNI
ncbi:hypothetical protein Leryth_026947 [Lithospermum erythrorhizon]|nr:hypothetical protein Leryth_026947 [Lithospermum erythrorhizon]